MLFFRTRTDPAPTPHTGNGQPGEDIEIGTHGSESTAEPPDAIDGTAEVTLR